MASGYKTAFGNPQEGFMWGFASDAGLPALGSTDLGAITGVSVGAGIGMMLQVEEACTITDIWFHIGTVSGTGIAATSLTATIWNVGTDGLPSTDAGGGSPTSVNFGVASGGSNNVGKYVTLTNALPVTVGQKIIITVQRNINTAQDTTTNHITVNGSLTNPLESLPYGITAPANGVWAKTGAVAPMMGYKSSTSSYGRPFTGTSIMTARAFGATVEAGSSFVAPTNFGSTLQINGVRIGLIDPTGSTTNTWQMALYSDPLGAAGGPTLMGTAQSFVTNQFGNSAGARRNATLRFTSLQTLTAGTKYGIGFGTTTATDSSIYSLDVDTATDLTAWDFQQQMTYMQRTGANYAAITGNTAGAFAETTTRRVWMSLLLADLTAPSGGSGMLVHPGMAGGARG